MPQRPKPTYAMLLPQIYCFLPHSSRRWCQCCTLLLLPPVHPGCGDRLCFGGASFRLGPFYLWASARYGKLPVPYAQGLIPFCYASGPGTSHFPLTLRPDPRRQSNAPGRGPSSSHLRCQDWAQLLILLGTSAPLCLSRSFSARLGLCPSLRSLRVSGPHAVLVKIPLFMLSWGFFPFGLLRPLRRTSPVLCSGSDLFCHASGPGFSLPCAPAARPGPAPPTSRSLFGPICAADLMPRVGSLTFAAGPGRSHSSDLAPWCLSIYRRPSSARLGLHPNLHSPHVIGPRAGTCQDLAPLRALLLTCVAPHRRPPLC
ncbi:hypothetical protein NDU88_000613 [Pleurodeles waltl]|uniref:Uncharacterized protein n=1 Tax=Pleurodeles waltl TaxID=8319 RepID=A0AAV7NBU5_PLEWA|nr:hypothetical protein NDU88_000613 [Pleurodeles waltl]